MSGRFAKRSDTTIQILFNNGSYPMNQLFEKQGWHILLLVLLLIGVVALTQNDVLTGQLWGIRTQVWLWIAVAVPVAHQVIVGVIWRGQLYHNWMKKAFGEEGFLVYNAIR